MPSKYTLALWDYDGETSTVSFEGTTIDELNLVVQDGMMDALMTAVNGVSLGVIFKDTRIFDYGLIAGAAPNDKDAQREKKWLVRMHDAVTFKKHTLEIPCADLSLLDDQNKGQMDKTLGAYTDLEGAIQNFIRTEIGNPVIVDEVVFVGRNL